MSRLPYTALVLALALSQPPDARFDPANAFPDGDRPLADLVRRGMPDAAAGDSWMLDGDALAGDADDERLLRAALTRPLGEDWRREERARHAMTRLAARHAAGGDRLGSVERLLEELEITAAEPAAVRYLRAMFYLGGPGVPTAERAVTYDRAVHALVDLTAEGHGPYSRKALATLGNLEMQRGAFTIARDTYRQYADLYPESPWAWVALIRAGLCEDELSRDAAAALLYLDAADRYGDLPLARVLGHAYAAAAFESRRDTQQALAHYRHALDGWDSRFGPVYDIHAPATRRRAARKPSRVRAIDREHLTARILALERAGTVSTRR
jgi:tetratricopeptide (TPR) repeat protein